MSGKLSEDRAVRSIKEGLHVEIVRKMGPRGRPELSRHRSAAFDHGESSRDDEKALRHFENGKTDV